MTKPKILYHASQNKNLEIIEPRQETFRNKSEGPVVFASSDKANVTKFLVPSDDSWTKKLRFGKNHIHIISDKERYEKADKGGAIYYLESTLFELDKNKVGGKNEWTSKIPTKPFNKEVFNSGLEAQLKNGVQVFFVDKETFNLIDKSKDHGKEIIKKLRASDKRS